MTTTITIRIAPAELASYHSALVAGGYIPTSKGDIMKAICRLWMHEHSPSAGKVLKESFDFVERRKIAPCDMTTNAMSAMSASKFLFPWTAEFKPSDRHAAHNIYAAVINNIVTVRECLNNKTERTRVITKKLVLIGALNDLD